MYPPAEPKKKPVNPSLPPGATPPPGYVDPSGFTPGPTPDLGTGMPAPPSSPFTPVAGPAPMMNSGAEQGPGATAQAQMPSEGQNTLGNPAAPPPPVAAAPSFPSLPPGATPPPGYVNPISGSVAPSAAPAGAPAKPAAPGSPTGAPAAPGAPAGTPAAPGGLDDAFRKALTERLGAKPVTDIASDPVLKAQSDAYGVQQQRAKERARESLAERAASSGQLSDTASSGAFDQGLVGLEQQQGEAQAANDAGLLGSRAQQDQQQLAQFMAIAGDKLSAEDRNALEKQMADLDAQVKREQIASGEKLGLADVATRQSGIDTQGKLGEGDLNLRLLLGKWANDLGLGQLGANIGEFNANRDDSNWWKMFGGSA